MSKREAPNHMERGTGKYRRWIHENSKKSDSAGKLPYSFSAPKKSKPRNTYVLCDHCGKGALVTEATIMVICSGCQKTFKVESKTSNAVFVWVPETVSENEE